MDEGRFITAAELHNHCEIRHKPQNAWMQSLSDKLDGLIKLVFVCLLTIIAGLFVQLVIGQSGSNQPIELIVNVEDSRVSEADTVYLKQ